MPPLLRIKPQLVAKSHSDLDSSDPLFGLRFDNYEEMPVERYHNTQHTYFIRKMLTYYEANRQKAHVHALGISNLRALTRKLDALDVIIVGNGSNVFLFANLEWFAADGPLDLGWVSGKREVVRLRD